MTGAHPAANPIPALQADSFGTPVDQSRRQRPALFERLFALVQRLPGLSDVRIKTRTRRLRLQEIVQMGDKRFVAILRVDGQEVLLGGSANSLSILTTLQPEASLQTFATALASAQTQPAQVRP